MELENLKNIWHKLELTEKSVNASQIQAMLRQKSNDALSQLKKRLFWDIVSGFLGNIIFVLAGILSTDSAWQILAAFFFFAYTPLLIKALLEYLKLRKIEFSDINLKEQLQKMIVYWEKALQKSLRIQQFLAPIGLVLSYRAGANLGAGEDFLLKLINKPLNFKTYLVWFIFIGVLVLMLLATHWFVKWYVKYLFGSQVNRLKNCLSELENTE
jgi:hypothetical protein